MTGLTARVALVVGLTLMASGCTIAPRSFREVDDPAPLVRARAVGLGRGLPSDMVVPSLISKLDDPDSVVRMTAHEQLKQRTGQDFGYVAWGGPEDRAAAVAQWRTWWAAQSGGAIHASSQNPGRVSVVPADYRRGRRGWRR